MKQKRKTMKRAVAILMTVSMLMQGCFVTGADEIVTPLAQETSESERQRAESEAQAESERQRVESEAQAESERQRAESEAQAESERQRAESEAQAESERQRAESEAQAESERQRAESEAQAESERQRAESEAQAESERQRAESEAQAESERQRAESEAQAESERQREEAEAQTEVQTEVPAETEVEEQTEVPAETETEAAAEAETETEVQTEAETETEEETEAPKTFFRYEDSRVIITAAAGEEAQLPQNCELRADYLMPGSAAYEAAAAAIEAQLGTKLGLGADNVALEYVLYDIYFLADNQRIEPEEGKVKVEMTFRNPVDPSEGTVLNRDVVHVKNSGEAEIVTDYIHTTASGEVTSMGFTQDSFSVSGLAVAAAVPRANSVDMADYITGASLIVVASDGKSYDLTKEKLPEGVTVPKDAPVKCSIFYNPKDVIFSAGDTITYQIPEGIQLSSKVSGNVNDGPTKVGTFEIEKNGSITITITNESYLADHLGKLKDGTINFSGSFDSSKWGQGGNKEIVFGDVKVTIPFEKDPEVTKGEVHIKKNLIDGKIKKDETTGSYYALYEVIVTTPSNNTMDMTDVYVTDAITAGENWVKNVVDVNTNGVGTYDLSTNTWTIGTMKPGRTYKLTYRVNLNNSIKNPGNDTNRRITNEATVYSGDIKEKDKVNADASNTLDIVKENTGYNKENGTVTYKVKVTAPKANTWPIENVTVQDIFMDNKDYVDHYVTVTPPAGTTVTQNPAAKTLDWNIGTMNPGEEKILTYTVKIKDSIFEGKGNDINRVLKNRATLKINGKEHKHVDSEVKFRKVWIWKNGQLQQNAPHKGHIKFSIHANESTGGGPVLDKNFTFEDKLTGDWVYDGDVIVRWYAQGPENKGKELGNDSFNVDGLKEWTWTHEGAYYYEFEYYARPSQDVIGKPSISNTAGIGYGEGGNNYKHEHTWKGTGNDYNGLEKEFVKVDKIDAGNGKTEYIATWQSVISGKIQKDSTYEDWRDGNHSWSFSTDQINGVTLVYDGNTLAAGTDYKIEKTNKGGFLITFLHAIDSSIAKPITVTYQCTLKTDDVKEGEDAKYVNRGKLTIGNNTDESSADYTFTQEQQLKKSAGTYDAKTGIMTWKIMVNITGSMKGEAKLTDDLPEGLEYVKAEITGRGSKAGAARMTVSVDEETKRNVVMNLTGLNASGDKDAFIEITLTTQITDEAFLIGNVSKKFMNTAVLEYNGGRKESSAEQTVKNNSLKKGGIYNANTAPNIVYTIEVNPNGLDMLKNGTRIRIKDEMGVGMMLLPDTLTMKNKTTNVPVPIENLNIETIQNDNGKATVFSFDVPDDKPLIITYEAYVEGEVGEQKEVTNKVSYYGEASTPSVEEENKITVSEGNATIAGDPVFYIKKMSATDSVTPLGGATFCLEKVTGIRNGEVLTEPVQEKETSAKASDKGIVFFGDLSKDEVYVFWEKQAPEGYYVDADNEAKTYIAFSKDAITQEMKDAGLEISVVQAGTTFYRFNKQGEIKVTKRFDANQFGSSVIADGTYYFGLFTDEAGTTLASLGGNNTSVQGITVTGGAVGDPIHFKGVPLGANGAAKTYYVYETDKDGKRLTPENDVVVVNGTRYTVSGDGSVAVDEQQPNEEMTITNTYAPAKVCLKGTKYLENAMYSDTKAFEFGLYGTDEDGEEKRIEKVSCTVENGKAEFAFAPLEFAETGTYHYTIREIVPEGVTEDKPTKNGITYDFTEYPVEITLEQNAEKGLYVKSVKSGEDGMSETSTGSGIYELPKQTAKDGQEAASFINTYATRTTLELNGEKTLDGAALLADDFAFIIRDITDPGADQSGVYTQTVRNAADRSFTFTLPEYTQADHNRTFVYEIAELNKDRDNKIENMPGVGYDETVYRVEVTVTDNGEGVLTANRKFFKESDEEMDEPEEAAAITFRNTFRGSVELTKTNGKTGEEREVLSGAEFELYRNVPEEEPVRIGTYTTDADGILFADDLEEGSYYLVETKAPAGYRILKDENDETIHYSFEIGPRGGNEAVNYTLEAGNEQKLGTLKLLKKDADDETKLLEGVAFELYQCSDPETEPVKIDTYVTDENGEITVNNLPWGSYYFVETKNLDGYVPDKTPTETVAINAEYVDGEVLTLVKENKQTEVSFKKTDLSTAKELPGAEMAVYEKSENGETGAEIERWTSTAEEPVHVIKGKLIAGRTYILKENFAPLGYAYAEDIEFTVEEDGTITAKADVITDEDGTKTGIIMADAPLHFNVNKVALADNTEEVDGAELTVYGRDADGAYTVEIDRWVSETGKTYDFGSKLEAGKDYLLKETLAPIGYKYAADIEFSVAKDGTIQTTAKSAADENGNVTYLVEDDVVVAELLKIDATTGKPLAGATLRVTDKDGKIVDEWITDETAHIITGKLAVNGTYTLTEVKAPQGYTIAEPVSFTVKADGTVDPVVMEDHMPISENAAVQVTKQLIENNLPINAVDQTFYVALYADEDCTKLASEVKPIVFKDAFSSTVEFTGLEIGRTYYVGECDMDGARILGGTLADGTVFAANFASGNKAEVKKANGVTTVTFANEFYELPEGFYMEGDLTITKKLLGSDGKAKKSDEVFYAGIFADKAHTVLSDQVSQNIVELALNGASEVSETVQAAITKGSALTLYVTEVDENGKPVAGSADFEYTVTVDKTSVTVDESHLEASVTITNREQEAETESETETAKSVKTGDDTNLTLYLTLLMVSVLLMIFLLVFRKRRGEV